MKKTVLSLTLLTLTASLSMAQSKAVRQVVKDASNGTATFVKFATDGSNDAGSGAKALKDFFKTTDNVAFRGAKTETDNLGFGHITFKQEYRGIPIEHGNYVVHTRNGEIESMSGDFKPIGDDFNTHASLSSASALDQAKAFVGASQYMWETEDAPETTVK